MRFFPLNIDSANLKCLVIGGGTIAYRKLKILLKANFNISVVAISCNEEVKNLINEHHIKLSTREFSAADINGYNLIVSATDNQEINRLAADTALDKGLLINVVDQPELSNFIFPAIIDRSPITISISSDGYSPTVSRFLRSELEKTIPFTVGKLAENASAIRNKNKELPAIEKKELWDNIFNNLSINSTIIKEDNQPTKDIQTTVHLGFSSPESITLRDYRLLHGASTIFFPTDTPKEIVEYFRREATQISYNNIREIEEAPQPPALSIILVNTDS